MNQPLSPQKQAILHDMLLRLDLVDPAATVNIGQLNVEANFFAETPSSFPDIYSTVRNVFIGMGTNVEFNSVLAPDVLIGRFCSIASFIHIGAGRHPMEHLSTGDFPKRREDRAKDEREKYNEDSLDVAKRRYTVIGNDVWIGVNACLIRSGLSQSVWWEGAGVDRMDEVDSLSGTIHYGDLSDEYITFNDQDYIHNLWLYAQRSGYMFPPTDNRHPQEGNYVFLDSHVEPLRRIDLHAPDTGYWRGNFPNIGYFHCRKWQNPPW